MDDYGGSDFCIMLVISNKITNVSGHSVVLLKGISGTVANNAEVKNVCS